MALGRKEFTAKIKVQVLTVDLKATSGLSNASKSIPSMSLAFPYVRLLPVNMELGRISHSPILSTIWEPCTFHVAKLQCHSRNHGIR